MPYLAGGIGALILGCTIPFLIPLPSESPQQTMKYQLPNPTRHAILSRATPYEWPLLWGAGG